MFRHVDAIFSQGASRPSQLLLPPEGARFHLSVEEKTDATSVQRTPKIHAIKLAHPEDATDFVMVIQENADSGVSAGQFHSEITA